MKVSEEYGIPDYKEIEGRIRAVRLTVYVKDAETHEPIKRAIVAGRQFVIPVVPRPTDSSGKTVFPIYARVRYVTIYAWKPGYKVTRVHVLVPLHLPSPSLTIYLKRR